MAACGPQQMAWCLFDRHVMMSHKRSKFTNNSTVCHDDVIKWKKIPRYWPFVRGIHRSTVNSPHKGQWRGALIFSLICTWKNGWVNNREAGDLRRHRVHYDVTVMVEYLVQHNLKHQISRLMVLCEGNPVIIHSNYRKISNIRRTVVCNKNCRSLRCSWSIACRRCSNYIFIFGSTSGFKVFGKDSHKTVRETFKCWDLVRLILKTWRYVSGSYASGRCSH